jgi:hypothetical protein
MATATEIMTKASAAIGAFGYSFSTEEELQAGLAKALDTSGISFRREVILSKRDRIDFMLDGGVGIEVKIDGSISALTRQLFRYADLPEINGLLVVVSANRLANLPTEINGKPVHRIRIMRAFQ